MRNHITHPEHTWCQQSHKNSTKDKLHEEFRLDLEFASAIRNQSKNNGKTDVTEVILFHKGSIIEDNPIHLGSKLFWSQE